jgi:hypothetical protein
MGIDTSKAITIGSVYCYDEGATEQLGPDASVEWTVVCDYTNRAAVALTILGSVTYSGLITTVVQPYAWPALPFMFARSVQMKGEGVMSVNGTTGLGDFQYARLTFTFRPKEAGSTDAVEVGEENLDFGSEVLSFNGADPFFKWKSDNVDVPAEASPGKIIPIITFTKLKKGLAFLPLDTLFAIAAAPLNNATYLGAPAGTLRFEGAQTSREFTTTGAKRWTMSVKLSYRPINWNYMLRPSTGTFAEIVTKVGGNPFYTSSNFSPLGLE